MIGIEVSCANGDVVKKALEKGMIVIAAVLMLSVWCLRL